MGVVGMALGYFIATSFFEFLRFVFVKKICVEFTFNLKLSRLTTCKEMLIFGVKSMLSNLPPILLLQTINIMIVSIIGPAALAIFARPVALSRHVHTFMNKFTLMLAPTAGAMSAGNDLGEIRRLYLNTTKLSFAFSLPALAFIFIYGDTLLLYWMGPEYALWPLVMILSVGQLLPLSQDSSLRILIGLNQHGKISIFAFITVAISFVVLLCLVGVQNWGLNTAAFMLVMPLTLVYGFLVPCYTCSKLSLNYSTYICNVLFKPLFYVAPYLTLLIISKFYFIHDYHLIALFAFILAISITLIIYFRMLLPPKGQEIIWIKIRGILHG